MHMQHIKFYFLLIFLVCTHLLWSQTRDTLYLWPDKVPNETGIKSRPVQTPDTSRNVVRITDITNPSLTVFKPADSINTQSAVIIAPGGAYQYLAINIEGYEIAEWLNTLGFTAFVLEYRTPDNRLGALNDIQRAIRKVRSLSDKYGIDADKVGVMGFSAGGNLALLAASNYLEPSYPDVDAVDVESSRPDFAVLLYPAYKKSENEIQAPQIKFHKNMPPVFLFGTFDDFLAEGFYDLRDAFLTVKAPFDMHLSETGGHGYGLRKGNPAAEKWPGLAEEWLQETLNKE